MTGPTLDEIAAELRREIKMRERVFAGWVQQGRLRQDQMDHRIACMAAALALVEEQQKKARLL